MPRNIAVIYGGKSKEHEISVKSAKNILNNINRKLFTPIEIKITKTGKWTLAKNNIAIGLNSNGEIYNFATKAPIEKISIVFPILHGPYGEDGKIQGFLETLNIPYVGSKVTSSAVCMDKDYTKRILASYHISTAKFLCLKRNELLPTFTEIINKIGKPFFVKPAHLGSSVGISKVKTKQDLLRAIKIAFDYDHKIILEQYINGQEIECGIIGTNDPIASELGEIIPNDEFYSYHAKYINKNGAKLIIPAKINKKLANKISKLAIKIYKIFECSSFARIDFFVSKTGKIYLNEINSIPGFTDISMFPMLWKNNNLSYQELITKIINQN